MTHPSADSLDQLADLCDLLSDHTRLRLVLLLAAGERNVTSLSDELRMRQPPVSHHLGLLRMCRLIVARRAGRQVIYALADNAKSEGGKLKISLPPFSVTVER